VNLSFSPSLYLNNLGNDNNVSFEPHKIERDVIEIDDNPKLFDQSFLNDLIRDLDLSKENSELGSRLKERNL